MSSIYCFIFCHNWKCNELHVLYNVLKYIYTPEIITKIKVMSKSIAQHGFVLSFCCFCSFLLGAQIEPRALHIQGTHSATMFYLQILKNTLLGHPILPWTIALLRDLLILSDLFSFPVVLNWCKLTYNLVLVWLLSFSILALTFIYVILWIHISFILCARSLYID